MDIEATLLEKIKRFESLKNQIAEISKKIGTLTEEQRALYNQGLEMKGGIDTLLAMKADAEKALAGSKTAGLTLPAGVAPVPAPVATDQTPGVAQPKSEAAKQPVTLEVK